MKDTAAFLTVDEAASLARVSHWTIRKYLHEAKLQRYRRLGRVMVRRAELLELLKPRKDKDHEQTF
jgi:excisionase family DNA binding protein